jgi:hypothetical protein
MFVNGLADPVNSWIVPNGIVSGIDHDDFEELVGSVLSDPVAIQDSESTNLPAYSLLSHWSKITSGLELIDTNGSWLASDDTLGNWSLATSSSDSHPVDDIAILGFVTKFSGLIRARRSAGSMDDWQLPELPSSHSQDEVHDIRLFASPQLFEIFVRTHLWYIKL